jgi:hypothetical protein
MTLSKLCRNEVDPCILNLFLPGIMVHTSLGYIVRPYLKRTKQNKQIKKLNETKQKLKTPNKNSTIEK